MRDICSRKERSLAVGAGHVPRSIGVILRDASTGYKGRN